MAMYGLKPWVKPFGKVSIFRRFELLVFIAQKGVFLFYNIVKDIFLASITKKKKLEKAPFLDQNVGLTPFEKCQFLAFQTFCFNSLERRFFLLEYRKRHVLDVHFLKKKLEKWALLDQNHGLTPLKKCQFFDFLNCLFLQPKKAFFRSRISQETYSWPILP